MQKISTNPEIFDGQFRKINKEIEDAFFSGKICETGLDRYIIRISDKISNYHTGHWLLMSKLTEAALLTAADYADNAEFKAAGDLLFNPRKIHVYMKGNRAPVLKNRHGRLSDQFNDKQKPYGDFIRWFARNAIVRQSQPALLPYLTDLLKSSGYVSEQYINSCHVRMKKISDTINFLMSWGICCFEDLALKMAKSDPRTRQFIKCHLCCFDTGWLDRINKEIAQNLN